MNKSFTINVSGGNVSFGAATQGDRSETSGTSSMSVSLEDASREMYRLLEALAMQSKVSSETRVGAESHAKELVAAVRVQDKSKVAASLELVQKNFSWAYPALKDFVKIAWPALLAAIGA